MGRAQRGVAGRLAAGVAAVLATVGVVASAPAYAAAGSVHATDPVLEAGGQCGQWRVSTVASGLGMLENLAFDGDGGLLLSQTGPLGEGAVRVLTPSGGGTVLSAEVPAPGGLVIDAGEVFVTSGNSALPGLFGTPDGALLAVDRVSGAVRTVAEGLVMPNGLARLPGGDFVVSRNLEGPGGGSGLTRVSPGDGGGSARLSPYAPAVRGANGVEYDGPRRRLVVSTSFEEATLVHLVDVDDPQARPRTLTLPGAGASNGADDLAVAADGTIYLALFSAGRVVRVDPDSGGSCAVAAGVPFVTSVAFGDGPGWDAGALYATSYDGTVRKLTPPPAGEIRPGAGLR